MKRSSITVSSQNSIITIVDFIIPITFIKTIHLSKLPLDRAITSEIRYRDPRPRCGSAIDDLGFLKRIATAARGVLWRTIRDRKAKSSGVS
jgi:hypothetical protein